MPTGKTIFSKPYGRLSAWRQLMLYPSQRKLAKMAAIHLRTRRQLAVFAWAESVQPGLFREATALDLGANIGNHSLFFADHFKQVQAFEPNERTFKVLTLNAELVGNVTCHQVGLSDMAGTAHFRVNPANIGSSRVVASAAPGTSEVRLTTLDAFTRGLADIKLIKVDVEGHDYAALVHGGRVRHHRAA
jgi:FkbM family methyltransferase